MGSDRSKVAGAGPDGSDDPRRDALVPAPDDGVDVTLIRWMLPSSAGERLATLQAQSDAMTRLRDAARER